MYKPSFLIALTKQLEETLELMEDPENADSEAAIALRNRFVTALVDLGMVDAEALGNGEWSPSSEPQEPAAEAAAGHARATALAERAIQERVTNATHARIPRPPRKTS